MTDQTLLLPTLERILYDEKFGTDTRFGLGPEQIFVDPDLAQSTILAILSDPDREFIGVDIDTFVNTQVNFDTPEDIISTMTAIYNTFAPEDVNYIFFQILQDAFVNKKEFAEIFKTSWVALQIRQNVVPPSEADPVDLNIEEDGICFIDISPLTPTPTPSVSPSVTPSVTAVTPTPTITPTRTESPTPSPTQTAAVTATITPSPTVTPTPTETPPLTAAVTPTPTQTVTPTSTAAATATPTPSPTQTPALTVSTTPSPTLTPTPTLTENASPTPTPTLTPTQDPTNSPTPSATDVTPTPTPTATLTPTLTPTPTPTPSGAAPLTNDGFSAGGQELVGPAPQTRITDITAFPFASPFTGGSGVGDLSVGKSVGGGTSSTTDGFNAGSTTAASVTTAQVDAFPFSSPFTLSTDVGDLTAGRYHMADTQSGTDGYHGGGSTSNSTPTSVLTIDQYPFASPFTTATDVGDIAPDATYGADGQHSTTDGYFSGGSSLGGAIDWTEIRRFPFSTPFTVTSDVGDLTQHHRLGAGWSSSTDGFSGGVPGSYVESFPFATPFTNSVNVGSASAISNGSIGNMSSPTDAFSLTVNLVSTFPFTTPFTTITQVGNLNPSLPGTYVSDMTGHSG